MEMRHGMPVWAPNDLEMAAIASRVAKERAKAAKEALSAARQMFKTGAEPQTTSKTDQSEV